MATTANAAVINYDVNNNAANARGLNPKIKKDKGSAKVKKTKKTKKAKKGKNSKSDRYVAAVAEVGFFSGRVNRHNSVEKGCKKWS